MKKPKIKKEKKKNANIKIVRFFTRPNIYMTFEIWKVSALACMQAHWYASLLNPFPKSAEWFLHHACSSLKSWYIYIYIYIYVSITTCIVTPQIFFLKQFFLMKIISKLDFIFNQCGWLFYGGVLNIWACESI